MVTDFEKAFEMGKFLVYKQEKNIAEAMTAVRLFVTGAIFALSPHELELIETRLTEHFEKIDQDPAFIIEDKKRYKPWVALTESDRYYSDRYVQYLRMNTNMAKKPIQAMFTDSHYILDRLGNPQSKMPFKRKGLVVGHVQSGKTANYISLINLAADYGYKLIILIAGVHNNLRSQTQARINEGFIGFDGMTQTRVGVGDLDVNDDKTRRPITFTNTQDDFSAKSKSIAALTPESTRVPIVLVIKKNGSTLRSLLKWLKQDHDEKAKYIIQYPALIIDDEADNASINTKKLKNADEDPTAINRLIRELMNQFQQASYVAYTATPYANIFIDPEMEHHHLGEDLFPDDFIVNLETPSNYCGPSQFFGNELSDVENGSGMAMCEIIDDYNQAIPIPTPKDHEISTLPDSLVDALRHYLIGMSVKSLRKVGNKHCSMLVNVAHRNQFQSEIKWLLNQELQTVCKAIQFEGCKNLDKALNNHHITHLHRVYREYFSHVEYTFAEVLVNLVNLVGMVQIREINNKSPEKLNYEDYKETGLCVIAVGGYSLSRGFTLEGLITSYLLRNTAMSDTLLQMGRWFGYRDGFVDLCKVFLPERTYNWYKFIGESMEELRCEFRSLRHSELTPRQYGLRVRSSPAGLMITAKGKMQSATQVTNSVSYSAKAYQLEELSLDQAINQKNVGLLQHFQQQLTPYKAQTSVANALLYQHIPAQDVLDFLYQFEYVNKAEISMCLQYIQDGEEQELAWWDVAFVSNSRASAHTIDLDDFKMHSVTRSLRSGMFEKASQPESVLLNDGGGRIARIWDEKLGLTTAQLQLAEDQIKAENTKQTAMYYRNNRERPLLILKVMDIYQSSNQAGQAAQLIQALVPGLAISFPLSPNNRASAYQVNKVYARYQDLLKRYEEADTDEEVIAD